MSTVKNAPRDINDLMLTRRPPLPPSPPPPPPVKQGRGATPPEEPGETAPATRKGTFILSAANDEHLHQLSFYTPGPKGDKSYIINQALEAYLAQHPNSRKPIPEGDDVRRRGRRHH